MTPREYAEVVVLPTVHHFLQARDDRRLAYLSCIATYHLCDYIGHADGATGQPVRDKLRTFCEVSVRIIRDLCNGTKHPENPRPFPPGSEKLAPVFAFDTPGAGFDEGRWNVPGLYVEHGGEKLFIDHCVQAVLLALQTFYPAHLADVDLTGLDTYMIAQHAEALRRQPVG